MWMSKLDKYSCTGRREKRAKWWYSQILLHIRNHVCPICRLVEERSEGAQEVTLHQLLIALSELILFLLYLSEMVGWKMRSAECGVWKMMSMENEEYGNCGVWKMRSHIFHTLHSAILIFHSTLRNLKTCQVWWPQHFVGDTCSRVTRCLEILSHVHGKIG